MYRAALSGPTGLFQRLQRNTGRGAAGAAMVRVSVLNDALKTMYNAEKRGKRQVLLRPSSKVVIKFLQVMQRHGELLPPPGYQHAAAMGDCNAAQNC